MPERLTHDPHSGPPLVSAPHSAVRTSAGNQFTLDRGRTRWTSASPLRRLRALEAAHVNCGDDPHQQQLIREIIRDYRRWCAERGIELPGEAPVAAEPAGAPHRTYSVATSLRRR